jgi:zinc protease
MGELLRAPSLSADSLEEAREQGLASLEAQRKEPASVAANALGRWGNPYRKGDPRYERSFDEMQADLKALKPAALKRFHQQFYGAGSLQFSAVGDLDVSAVRSAVEAAFKGFNAPQRFVRIPQPLVDVKPERLVLKTPDKQNATLMATLDLPVTELHADYPALMIANFMLGGSGNSRLWKRVREAEGLSYDVRSSIDWNPFEANSSWQISAIFAPQNRDKVEKAVREELTKALKDGFTAAELAQAQQGLLNFRRLSRAQDSRLAMSLSQNLYLKRDFKVSAQIDTALSQLTAAQVNEALRKYLKPSDWVTAVAGDFK